MAATTQAEARRIAAGGKPAMIELDKFTRGGVAGMRFVSGQMTTASASDTVVTGLATVVSAVANLEDAPGDDPETVTAVIGNQAGAPAAGSVLIKTWKNTGGTDPTLVAATTFSKKVNWIAVGT